MYLASCQVTTMYLADDYDLHVAYNFLKQEFSSGSHPIKVTEISSYEFLKDCPKNWRDGSALLWGSDEDLSAKEFLKDKSFINDEEYKEYLRLKEKFKKFE